MDKFKKTLLNTHIGILIILVTNFVLNAVFEITLISDLRFLLKIIYYASGCILFFYYVKPFKKVSLYFSIYIISPIIIFLSWLMDGILGALLASIFIFLFAPDDCRFKNDQIQINKKVGGLLGICCKYEVIEKKYFLFERSIAEFRFEKNIYFRKNGVKIQDNILQIPLLLKDYNFGEDHYIAKDTIIYIALKN